MSTKETQQTKQTLNQNKQKFKKLQTKLESMQDEFQRKILREINILDKEQNKKIAQMSGRKKALALKGSIRDNYIEDDRSAEEVPVDGELKTGTMVFMKSCSKCHSLDAVDGKPMKGPSLGLIYNRRVGSNMNFELYSNSMLKQAFFWSPLNLYRFMANANSLVPKTNCWLAKYPLKSESERADLITMFREFTTEMSFNIRLKEIERVGYNTFQTNLKGEEEMKTRGDTRDKRQSKLNQKL